MATTFPRMFQYRPIYQGIGLEAVQQDLQLRGEAFDTNLENYNKVMQYASTIRALPGDQKYVSDVFKSANEHIKHIADQTQGSQRWDLGRTAVNRMAARITQDPTLIAIQESYKNFQEGEKVKLDLRQKGHTPLDFGDFTQHRTVQDDGSINIYQPTVEAKGNYVAEAGKLWATLEPEMINLGLTKSDIAGILEGKTVKGITKERILGAADNIFRTYMETDSGRQQRRLAIHEGSETPDQDIRDFVLGIGMLREHTQEAVAYQADREWDYAMQARLALLKGEQTSAKRSSTGRPNYEDSTDALLKDVKLTYEKGEVQGKEQLRKVNVITFGNKEIVDGLSGTVAPPDPMTYKFIGAGAEKDKLNKKLSKGEISIQPNGIKIIGIIPTNTLGEEYRGGYYATVDFREGSSKNTRSAQVVIKANNSSLIANTKTYSDIIEASEKVPDGKSYYIDDTSGLLDVAHLKLAEEAQNLGIIGSNSTLKFRVTPVEPIGGVPAAKVVPVLQNSKGETQELAPEVLRYLGLIPEYDLSGVTSLLKDVLYKRDLRSYTATSSQL